MTSREQITEALVRRLAEQGRSMAWLSRALGRNATYILQFIERGSPKMLRYEDRETIARLLKMPRADLGLDGGASPEAALPSSGGLAENAEPFAAEGVPYLKAGPHITFLRMRTDDLAECPLQIKPGAVLVFDLNEVDITRLPAGRIMVFQMADRETLGRSHGSLVGQILPPDKVVSNRPGVNWITRLDDPERPFLLVPRGALLTVIRAV